MKNVYTFLLGSGSGYLEKYVLIFVLSALNTFANVFFKVGMQFVGGIDIHNLFATFRQLISNIYIISGGFCYIISFFLLLQVISKIDLSYVAAVFISSFLIMVTIVSKIIFHENISLIRLVGILVICIGAFLVCKS